MKKSLKILIPILVTFVAIQASLESNEKNFKRTHFMNALITTYNVCDPSLIYNEEYNYSLPKGVLESFLSGKAFDHKVDYTADESARLQNDIEEIFQTILSTSPLKEKVAIMTAGAPGSGKTTLMVQDSIGKSIAYICPDDVCLKSQARTYLADIASSDGSKESRQEAYNKWRPGSNAATHLILGNLIRENYAFYFGTTSTGPVTYKFFDFLKNQGYQIRLLHVTAPDSVRWESIQERDKTFVQTTEEDIREKGLLLPQRISDTFLAFADEIEFYYRAGVKEDAQLAAKWIRREDPQLQIVSPDLYEKVKAIHNTGVEALNRPELCWEFTVEQNRKEQVLRP